MRLYFFFGLDTHSSTFFRHFDCWVWFCMMALSNIWPVDVPSLTVFRDPSVLVCYLEWCWIYEILISVKLVWPLSSSQTYNAVVIISLLYSDKREIIKYEFEPYFIANYKCVIWLDFITLGRYCGWWNMNLTEPSSQYLLLWYVSCNLDESKAATLPMEMDIFD